MLLGMTTWGVTTEAASGNVSPRMQATQTVPTLRIIGIVLLLWAYGMNVHSVIGAWEELHQSPEAAAQEHREEMARQSSRGSGHAGMDMSGEPPAPSPAALVLTAVLLAAGALVALFPVRWGAWYGVWATLVVWLAIAAPRIARDPRCWQVLDPNKHGCHTFMLSVAIGVAGMVCCAVAQRSGQADD